MTTEQQQTVEQPQQIDQQQQQQQPIDQQQQQQQQQQQPMVPQQQQQQMIPQQDQVDENLNIATVSDGGRELSKTILYVGNIHKSVAEEMLRDLFASLGSNVQSLKILHDKNKPGFNYSFVEYETNDAAEKALSTLNGTALANYPLKITWAFQTQQNKTSDAFNLFVGDLSLEIDDDSLSKYFNQFPSLIQANVMWDMKTGRSRGYGFVSFRDQQDAENALQTMNGEPLGGRPIRLNWASHKQQNFPNKNPRHHHNGMNNMNNNVMPVNGMDMGNGNRAPIMGPQSYEMVSRQTPNWLSVVYLGNLAHYTTQNDLIPLLQNFGYIVNFKLISEKGCAFVTYDSHERAALAIVQLSGFTINGRPLKCGWGKSNKVINRNNIPVIRN